MSHKLFGYYDEKTDWDKPATPTYDPGLETECLFCFKPLMVPIKTISLMKVGDAKSYFYRVHKECYETATPEEITTYESTLIDEV